MTKEQILAQPGKSDAEKRAEMATVFCTPDGRCTTLSVLIDHDVGAGYAAWLNLATKKFSTGWRVATPDDIAEYARKSTR